MTKIAINGDDFGLSDGVCRAIIELLEANAISNTTIMVAAEGAVERSRQWGVSGLRGVAGVHLQLSVGRPLSPSSEVSSLVDRNGAFRPREEIATPDPAEVMIEWRRQIQLTAELLGGPATHLDSHQGAHRLPGCFDVYLALAAEFGLAVRGAPTLEYAEKMARAGVAGSTIINRDWTGRSLGLRALKRSIKDMAKQVDRDAVIEIVTHPAYIDEHLVRSSSLNRPREQDKNDLFALARQRWLERHGYQLVAFPALAPRRPWTRPR
jgi:predicted glycoside hydrolase/deacetylase ChbG (UPF0249 family)